MILPSCWFWVVLGGCGWCGVPVGHGVGVVGVDAFHRDLAVRGERGRVFDPRDGAALSTTTTTTTTTTRY